MDARWRGSGSGRRSSSRRSAGRTARIPSGTSEPFCTICGDDIPEGRRRAVPRVRTCLACRAGATVHWPQHSIGGVARIFSCGGAPLPGRRGSRLSRPRTRRLRPFLGFPTSDADSSLRITDFQARLSACEVVMGGRIADDPLWAMQTSIADTARRCVVVEKDRISRKLALNGRWFHFAAG
ncbi:TraR/DksA C4-type zinc finger protein [Sphingomonas albertensis]|uniref:TraR/DksA C4-type zinc finger protein n=1 Tax=Sphingomonas albertensis TaxID=2762591 RepID=UPI002E2CEA85|nr:TraR/DksA C4-type zinc finger protein [Sphingomonas albertensis]